MACTDEKIAELSVALGSGDDTTAANVICSLLHAHNGVDGTASSVDSSFMLFSGYMVFLMQAGFAMLCAGSVRSKNTMNILVKNVLDACVGAIAFYLFGYGVAYGTTDGTEPNGFIGSGMFGLSKFTDWQFWLFQWAFSAAAATIVSGSVAERTMFEAYLAYSFFLTAFVYPTVAHWVWDGNGWLSGFHEDPLFDTGMLDFAGSGVVHMVGGFAGLCGAIAVGPRMGRFKVDGTPVDIPGHSATMVVLGTFILWFGWYGFNPGSMLTIIGSDSQLVVGRAAVTTTLAAASGGLSALAISWRQSAVIDLIAVCNGLLAGLVSVTAGCAVIEPWAAILCGAMGAGWFKLASKMLLRFRIDDPLEAAPMHGFCGVWGVLYVGLFAKKEYVMQTYGRDDSTPYGLLYGGGGELIACQIIGILAILSWTCGMMLPFFFGFRSINMLRVPPNEEEAGIDVSHHGGNAYNMEQVGGPTSLPK